jgi:hypothetical protein
MKLLLAATSKDGKALVAEVGDQALQAASKGLRACASWRPVQQRMC